MSPYLTTDHSSRHEVNTTPLFNRTAQNTGEGATYQARLSLDPENLEPVSSLGFACGFNKKTEDKYDSLCFTLQSELVIDGLLNLINDENISSEDIYQIIQETEEQVTHKRDQYIEGNTRKTEIEYDNQISSIKLARLMHMAEVVDEAAQTNRQLEETYQHELKQYTEYMSQLTTQKEFVNSLLQTGKIEQSQIDIMDNILNKPLRYHTDEDIKRSWGVIEPILKYWLTSPEGKKSDSLNMLRDQLKNTDIFFRDDFIDGLCKDQGKLQYMLAGAHIYKDYKCDDDRLTMIGHYLSGTETGQFTHKHRVVLTNALLTMFALPQPNIRKPNQPNFACNSFVVKDLQPELPELPNYKMPTREEFNVDLKNIQPADEQQIEDKDLIKGQFNSLTTDAKLMVFCDYLKNLQTEPFGHGTEQYKKLMNQVCEIKKKHGQNPEFYLDFKAEMSRRNDLFNEKSVQEEFKTLASKTCDELEGMEDVHDLIEQGGKIVRTINQVTHVYLEKAYTDKSLTKQYLMLLKTELQNAYKNNIKKLPDADMRGYEARYKDSISTLEKIITDDTPEITGVNDLKYRVINKCIEPIILMQGLARYGRSKLILSLATFFGLRMY